MHYPYVIVGGGLAASAAVEGIRSRDPDGPILMLSRENHLPYQRPPLTKDLWYGRIELEHMPVHDDSFYRSRKVEVALRREAVEIDAEHGVLWDERGESCGYDALLIATGCRPRRLNVPGAEGENVRYFRDLEDYFGLASRLDRFQHLTIVGGGFTGVEIAAAMSHAGKEVTLMLPEEYPLFRTLPRELGFSIAELFREHNVELVSGETPTEIEERQGLLLAKTVSGNFLTTQLVLVDQGGEPNVELAEAAGLEIDDGVVVDQYARTSNPKIYAAGDVAEFPYLALGQLMRLEQADHAKHHGFTAGANMAGANQPYTHLPSFWFEVFDRHFEAVGDVNPRLQTEAVWTVPVTEGVVYYLRDDVVRGVLLCGLRGRIEWARELVRSGKVMSAAERAFVAE